MVRSANAITEEKRLQFGGVAAAAETPGRKAAAGGEVRSRARGVTPRKSFGRMSAEHEGGARVEGEEAAGPRRRNKQHGRRK